MKKLIVVFVSILVFSASAYAHSMGGGGMMVGQEEHDDADGQNDGEYENDDARDKMGSMPMKGMKGGPSATEPQKEEPNKEAPAKEEAPKSDEHQH